MPLTCDQNTEKIINQNISMWTAICLVLFFSAILFSCSFKSAEDYVVEGANLGQSGKHWEAIAAYGKAIEKDPKLSSAYLGRGVAYCKLLEDQKCLENLHIAAELGNSQAQNFLRRVAEEKRIAGEKRTAAAGPAFFPMFPNQRQQEDDCVGSGNYGECVMEQLLGRKKSNRTVIREELENYEQNRRRHEQFQRLLYD